VRIGSITSLNDGKQRVEINTVEAVQNSRSKLLMKQCFTRDNVKTADWWKYDNATKGFHQEDNGPTVTLENLPYPIIAKSHFGQGGAGNTKLDNQAALEAWMRGKDLSNYIFEKFYNYSREYRLHVTQEENFLSWRKMRRRDAQDRWYFNSNNCVWIGEENPLFDKPVNWEEIQRECIKAANAVTLDICAIDVRVQSRINDNGNRRRTCDFIILETNSAPALGEVGQRVYAEKINQLINKKINDALQH
jgi:glutathione synthase/RimK-type ligase-like ATP-grasp enzyme